MPVKMRQAVAIVGCSDALVSADAVNIGTVGSRVSNDQDDAGRGGAAQDEAGRGVGQGTLTIASPSLKSYRPVGRYLEVLLTG